MCATKPMPQASCSLRGSYRPCACKGAIVVAPSGLDSTIVRCSKKATGFYVQTSGRPIDEWGEGLGMRGEGAAAGADADRVAEGARLRAPARAGNVFRAGCKSPPAVGPQGRARERFRR